MLMVVKSSILDKVKVKDNLLLIVLLGFSLESTLKDFIAFSFRWQKRKTLRLLCLLMMDAFPHWPMPCSKHVLIPVSSPMPIHPDLPQCETRGEDILESVASTVLKSTKATLPRFV